MLCVINTDYIIICSILRETPFTNSPAMRTTIETPVTVTDSPAMRTTRETPVTAMQTLGIEVDGKVFA